MEDNEAPDVRQYDYTFTIIIPHHGIPQLLQRCVASIPERDDMQIIVVDDNSPDGDRYLELYPFLHRKNLEYYPTHEGRGAGYARNVGLDHARGKWLLFADADDFFTYCFGEMLDKYKDSEVDMVFFNCNSCDSEYYTPSDRVYRSNWLIDLEKTNYEDVEYGLRYDRTVPWCRLLKHDVVQRHKIRFDETPINDDTYFACQVGYYAQNVAIDPHAIYMVTMRSGSLSFKKRSDEIRLACIDVHARYERFLRDHGVKICRRRTMHYNELTVMVIHREWSLFRQGIAVLRKYGFSNSNVICGITWWVKGRVLRRLHIA